MTTGAREGVRLYNVAERPDLRQGAGQISGAVWPDFMHEDPVANRAWEYLFGPFARFSVVLCDEHDRVLAHGASMPLAWDGDLDLLPEGWDAAAEQSMHDLQAGIRPTALNAYAIAVAPAQQGKGYSALILKALRDAGREEGMHSLLACVRPTLKAQYPLTPIERYARWTRPDGAPFDPWMRVHWRAGATIVRTSPRSMLITGTVAEWEQWAHMAFPESGNYVVPGALQPVMIDRERDVGTYEDPNVWMLHRLGG